MRKPQINFQVEPALKMLYEEVRAWGYRPTRLCAAGFLLMVEDPRVRRRGLARLRHWEADQAGASSEAIREFARHLDGSTGKIDTGD